MLANNQEKNISRRAFLNQVGKVGGAVAVYGAMDSLGLLGNSMFASAAEFKAPKKSELAMVNKTGKKVIILGGGIAGLASAYELSKAGYDCQIFEARDRVGGRNWTVRGGTTETELGGVKQVARFDKGQYMNAGPARIPQHHVTIDYCRELGVELEVFTNINEAGYYFHENAGPLSNKKIRKREIKADTRGYVAELLTKVANQSALDQELTSQDIERLKAFLSSDGALNASKKYTGTGYRGYLEDDLPGAGLKPGTVGTPHAFKDILESGMMNQFSSEYSFDQQMMVFQPVGGMDQIPKALAERLPGKITFGAEIREIRQSADGVRIVYKKGNGPVKQVTGDYCICTIPLPVLSKIPADFSPEMKNAIKSIGYATTGKIGFQFKTRFWETEDRIMGGMTTTNMDINQIWYPSYGYLSPKGVVIGYYNFGQSAVDYGNLPLKERERRALAQGTKIHKQYTSELEHSFSVAWHKIKYNEGGWASYSSSDRKNYYPTLNEPQGRIYLAGEHLSYLTGWMAGAFESARIAVSRIHERTLKETRKPVTVG